MPIVAPPVTPATSDVPPQNLEAERSVLGAMLVASSAMKRVRVESGLTARHFYLDKHQRIFSAIAKVAERNGSVDELMVAHELPDQKLYLAEMVATVPAAGNALHYASIVLSCAQLRAKLAGAQSIIEGVRERADEERSAELIREGLQLAASDFAVEAEPTTGEEVMSELFDWLNDPLEPEIFVLPWAALNESVLGGFRRKQMSVFAGWPKMGKSFAVDQTLTAFADQGKRCAIFAPEVSRMERAVRHLTMTTGVASEKILRKSLDQHEMAKVVKAMNAGLPFDYFEAPGWGVERIAERIIYGGYDIVAVDPVTKIPGFEKTEVASAVVGRLTEVASRADCHVILVSHLNRSRGTSPGGVRPRPTVADLRGSGMIEGDAHAILFLHRDQDDKANVLRTGEIYVDRSRLGPSKSVRVAQLARTLRFIPIDEAEAGGVQSALEVGNVQEPPPGHDRTRETV